MSDIERTGSREEIETDSERTTTVKSVLVKRSCLNAIVKVLFSTPGLVILVILYSIMGALIFPLLEAPREIRNNAAIAKSREDCLKELWTITEKLNVLYEKNWTTQVQEELRRFEGSIISATKNELSGMEIGRSPRWTFSESFLYSITVITTIGHYNLTPRTSGGKVMTILYALIGVPLMLMCLSSLGGLLAEVLQYMYSHVCCTRRRKTDESNTKSFIGQSHEMDCDVCKYDAIPSETKPQNYDYLTKGERDDSCSLIQNSPQKFMQIRAHPTVIQYTIKSADNSPIKHHGINQQHQHSSKDYLITPNTCNQNSININTGSNTGHLHNPDVSSGGVGGVGVGGVDTGPTMTTLYCPIAPNVGTHFTCNSTIHLNHPNIKFQRVHLHNKLPQNKNFDTNVHTATVHGTRGKFLLKPISPEISMLLEANDISSRHDIRNLNEQTKGSFGSVDMMEDEEENEQNRVGCPHGTPSRIPLIASSKKHLDADIELEATSEDTDNINHRDSHHQKNRYQRGGNGGGGGGSGNNHHHHHSNHHHSHHSSHHHHQDHHHHHHHHHQQENNRPQVPISLVLIILITYILIGTIIFSFWEGWSLIDGAYFCFVTLSTIGYGDFLPRQIFLGPDIQLFACCAYLLLGLVLVAMSFSILETQLMWKCKQIVVRLKTNSKD